MADGRERRQRGAEADPFGGRGEEQAAGEKTQFYLVVIVFSVVVVWPACLAGQLTGLCRRSPPPFVQARMTGIGVFRGSV